MPSAVVLPEDHSNHSTEQGFIPEILRTPSGTLLVEIQGTINVGTRPLITSDLDLQVKDQEYNDNDDDNDCSTDPIMTSSSAQFEKAVLRRLGRLDFSSHLNGKGKEVVLDIGRHQRLRGKITQLDPPLALLHMNPTDSPRVPLTNVKPSSVVIPVVEVIRHKLVFNYRPEPVVY